MIASLFRGESFMALAAGARLGSYEILSALGSGGMGEVYRARDTKLDRDVAIKILPESAAADPERIARFEREAKTLAALNHPHIAHIHGLEGANRSTGSGHIGQALVMELVDGPTLADRIASGPLPLDEALPIAKQIADALEAAHSVGIVHRDLKPANIKVRSDGTVKVLDFGLAKALAPVAGSGDLANSPTLTFTATQAGVILGTAAYMSPEQARGSAADKRADIWAFGVVLFEMLAGRPLFGGDTISDTLAAVLKAEPPWSDLPAAVPPQLRQLLRWCLEKDPKRRLRDIGDARIQIDEALAGATVETPSAPRAPRALVWRALPWIVAGVLALALALNLWGPRSQSTLVLRTFSHVGADVTFTIAGVDVLAISPDGATVSFVAQPRGGSAQLFVRRLDRLDATPLPGTEGATQPFFSPDGTRIGFFAGGLLKTVAVTGGAPPATLCPAPISRGGAWGDDETIVFMGNRVGPLMRISSRGGQPVPLAALADGEVTQRWPQFLPGGRKVLFTSNRLANEGYSDANLVVYDISNGTRKVVRQGGYHGRYLPSGHLVYLQGGALFGAAFDVDRLEVIGAPVSIIDGILTQADSGAAQFDVSATGTLVYQPGPVLGRGGAPIEWVSADGTAAALRTTPANWFNLRLAPDGRRLALQIGERDSDIWIYEWSRNNLSKVTLDHAGNSCPVWTPDARHLAFASTRGGAASNLYWQRVGQGEIERLTDSPNAQRPGSFHPSSKYLAFEEQNADGNLDVMILPLEGDEASGWKPGRATAFQRTSADERDPVFSPDGRWLAYVSNESGRDEIHVRSFPGAGSKVVMSSGGGSNPVWSPTRNELFYGSTGQIMVVPFTVKDGVLIPEPPRLWSSVRYQTRGPNRMFDVSTDGTRLALARFEQVEGRVSPDHLAFVFNFFDHLRAAARRSP